MKKVIKIDSNGLFLEDVLMKDDGITPSDCIDVECKGGFYHPKWDGTTWVEGKTQVEIDAVISTQEPIPDPNLTLQEQIDLLTMMVLELGGELSV